LKIGAGVGKVISKPLSVVGYPSHWKISIDVVGVDLTGHS
jgi:hypothetical protein